MNKRHPGRFGHIVAEIIQDIVGAGVVAINGIGLVIMAAVLAKYVPYKHFYHVVGNVVVYACLAAAIAMPFFVHHWRKRRPGAHPATDYVGRSWATHVDWHDVYREASFTRDAWYVT